MRIQLIVPDYMPAYFCCLLFTDRYMEDDLVYNQKDHTGGGTNNPLMAMTRFPYTMNV